MRTIRNKVTGETRQINDSELANYGLGGQPQAQGQVPMMGQVQPQMGQPQGQAGNIDLNNLRNVLLAAALSNPKEASKYSTIFNIAKPTAFETSKLQESKEVGNITGPLKELKTTVNKGIRNYNDYVTFNTQRNLVSQSIAKLIERNRLSDTDRTFYLSNFPSFIETLLTPDAAKIKLNVVENYLKVRLGSNTERAVTEEEGKQSLEDLFSSNF